jgi:hypothetical protein
VTIKANVADEEAAARAASYAHPEGGPDEPAMPRVEADPDFPDDFRHLRLAIFRDGPMAEVSKPTGLWRGSQAAVAVPAAPCIHVHFRSPGHWRLGTVRDSGQRVLRYLHAGISPHGFFLYDFAGEVDEAGCVPPRGLLRDLQVASNALRRVRFSDVADRLRLVR